MTTKLKWGATLLIFGGLIVIYPWLRAKFDSKTDQTEAHPSTANGAGTNRANPRPAGDPESSARDTTQADNYLKTSASQTPDKTDGPASPGTGPHLQPSANESDENPATLRNLDEFRKKYGEEWTAIYGPDQEIQSLTGGLIPIPGESAKWLGDFAREIAPTLGAASADFSGDAKLTNEQGRSRVFEIAQRHRVEGTDYEVYQSFMSVLTRKADDAIFMVNAKVHEINDLPMPPPAMNPEAKVRDDLILELKAKLPTAVSALNCQFLRGPVIFVESSRTSDFGYIYLCNWTFPGTQAKEEIVFSATGRGILSRQTNILY